MRVLLDECVPRALRGELHGHEVKTVAEAGFAGVKNGKLLELAAKEFDLLLTVDRNLEYQQNFTGLALAVIVVHAPSNDIAVLSAANARSTRSYFRGQARRGDASPRLTGRWNQMDQARIIF